MTDRIADVIVVAPDPVVVAERLRGSVEPTDLPEHAKLVLDAASLLELLAGQRAALREALRAAADVPDSMTIGTAVTVLENLRSAARSVLEATV